MSSAALSIVHYARAERVDINDAWREMLDACALADHPEVTRRADLLKRAEREEKAARGQNIHAARAILCAAFWLGVQGEYPRRQAHTLSIGCILALVVGESLPQAARATLRPSSFEAARLAHLAAVDRALAS